MQTVRSSVRHTASTGTAQKYYGSVVLTQVEYPRLLDLQSMPANVVAQAERSMLSNLMLPEGSKFRPQWTVTRRDLAEAIVRAGLVPQYMAASPVYSDVRDDASRGAVESVQANPSGALFVDVAGGRFVPNNAVTKIAAAIAFVRAAGLESQAAGATLPLTIADAYTIPSVWRGYAAVALQNGLISLDGNNFAPGRAITRIELATALNRLVDR